MLLFSAAAVTAGAFLTLNPTLAHAQGGVPLWTRRYNGSVPGYGSQARAIAVDKNGNVFVTGSSSRTNSLQDFPVFTTVKYSNAGVLIWTNHYSGTPEHGGSATAIAVDRGGNVFVTGTSYNGNSQDYATIAYSNSGVPLWTNRYDGPESGQDSASAIAVNTNGNVFITGLSWNGSNHDYATLAYSNEGVPLWINRHGPASLDSSPAIAVDHSGNVFVTGSAYNGSNYDYATIKYSSAGVPQWTNRYNGPGNTTDFARAIAVDSSGNVVVTGRSSSGSDYTTDDYATIAYSNSGIPLWTNRYNGLANDIGDPSAIAVDRNGNVFVTGTSYDANLISSDYCTIKCSPGGVPLWTNYYNGPANGSDDNPVMAVDSSGNVFVTGRSASRNQWPNYYDYATVGYSGSGIVLWTQRFSGPGNNDDEARAVAVDTSGNVFITGTSLAANGTTEFATIKYSSSVPPPRLDFQKLNYELVLSWTNAGFNLQSAPAVTGPFTNLPAATSPYTNPLTAAQQFFRLISN